MEKLRRGIDHIGQRQLRAGSTSVPRTDTWGVEPSFAAFARALGNLEEAAVHMVVELKNAAFDLMAAESPLCQISAVQRMSGLADVMRPNPLLHKSEKIAIPAMAVFEKPPPT